MTIEKMKPASPSRRLWNCEGSTTSMNSPEEIKRRCARLLDVCAVAVDEGRGMMSMGIP